jgi:L-alanine-DL-glutamate epimerase-like enolase superfamily enzyme
VSPPDAQAWADALGDVLRALEQPCQPGDWNSSVPLVASGLPVYLDEAIRSINDVRHAARYRAAVGVCVKVERVGGFAMARRVIESAETEGLAVYLGGFFESPWAKRWHRAFASQFDLGPSDVTGPDGVERPEPHGEVWRVTLE